MSNTARTRELELAAGARQDFDPRSTDDADYALAHPSEFDEATLAICLRTVEMANVRARG